MVIYKQHVAGAQYHTDAWAGCLNNSFKGDVMRKGFWKQLSYEDKFDRKYACWAVNHNGWRKASAGTGELPGAR